MSDDISRKILEAERIERSSRPTEPRRDWKKAVCTHCGYKISYVPVPGKWVGRLRCPDCGKFFEVKEEISEEKENHKGPKLDDYVGEESPHEFSER